jgi:hypothetical protein
MIAGDKDSPDIDRERELYEYHHQQAQQIPAQHQQTIHLTPNHPHLRHIGHPPSSIICIQSPPSHQNSVQNSHHHSESLHEIHHLKAKDSEGLVQNSSSHYNQSQANGESRPSVIESNQPMIIECT